MEESVWFIAGIGATGVRARYPIDVVAGARILRFTAVGNYGRRLRKREDERNGGERHWHDQHGREKEEQKYSPCQSAYAGH